MNALEAYRRQLQRLAARPTGVSPDVQRIFGAQALSGANVNEILRLPAHTDGILPVYNDADEEYFVVGISDPNGTIDNHVF